MQLNVLNDLAEANRRWTEKKEESDCGVVGSLGFRIVLLLIPGSQISVWHSCGLSVFVVRFTSAIPIT